jgi:DNA polymerase-4
MDHSVVHMDLDSFFVSVSTIRHPELKGLPVAIGGSFVSLRVTFPS